MRIKWSVFKLLFDSFLNAILRRIPYVQRLETDLQKALLGDVSIAKMHIENGVLKASFKTKITLICAEWAYAILKEYPTAENYIEIPFAHNSEPFAGSIRIQLHSGKTPHELRMLAEAERDALKEELKLLKGAYSDGKSTD